MRGILLAIHGLVLHALVDRHPTWESVMPLTAAAPQASSLNLAPNDQVSTALGMDIEAIKAILAFQLQLLMRSHTCSSW